MNVPFVIAVILQSLLKDKEMIITTLLLLFLNQIVLIISFENFIQKLNNQGKHILSALHNTMLYQKPVNSHFWLHVDLIFLFFVFNGIYYLFSYLLCVNLFTLWQPTAGAIIVELIWVQVKKGLQFN